MDQTALIILMSAALLSGKPAPTLPRGGPPATGASEDAKVAPSVRPATDAGRAESSSPSNGAEPYMRPPIPFCRSVANEAPRLGDIALQRPFKVTAPAGRAMLNDLAAFMREHNCGVRIEGYADDRGGA